MVASMAEGSVGRWPIRILSWPVTLLTSVKLHIRPGVKKGVCDGGTDHGFLNAVVSHGTDEPKA
jgi:hypothetical protein